MADTLSITDNRTGKTYEIPIADGTIRSTDLKKITTGGDDPGLATYDPAYMNTVAGQAIFYDIAFGNWIGDQAQPKRFGFIAPAVKEKVIWATITEEDRRQDFQAIAPETEAGLYLVPKVIE